MERYECHERLEVVVPDCSYPIIICSHGIKHSELLPSLVSSNQLMIVTDEVVAPLYLDDVCSLFATIQCDVVVLPAGERTKSYSYLTSIYDGLMENKHRRDTTLLALGGGVVGDITGLAASTYQRGVALIQVPTTLLAQVDAAVGGKTAINHPLGKNMIGTFYQPKAVVADVTTLRSLPKREFVAGLAEVIKYALLMGEDWCEALRETLQGGLDATNPELPHWVAQCCRVKAQYVVQDEKDQGTRALLNLGHTFAHALEVVTGYERWLHGEAVAIGLYCAALLSCNLGIMAVSWLHYVESMLIQAGLPHKIPRGVDLRQLMHSMERDKKVGNNKRSFIVMEKPGHCYFERNVTEDGLYDTLSGALEGA